MKDGESLENMTPRPSVLEVQPLQHSSGGHTHLLDNQPGAPPLTGRGLSLGPSVSGMCRELTGKVSLPQSAGSKEGRERERERESLREMCVLEFTCMPVAEE